MTHNGQPFRVSSCVTRAPLAASSTVRGLAALLLVACRCSMVNPQPGSRVQTGLLQLRAGLSCDSQFLVGRHLLPHRALWTGLGMRTNRYCRHLCDVLASLWQNGPIPKSPQTRTRRRNSAACPTAMISCSLTTSSSSSMHPGARTTRSVTCGSAAMQSFAASGRSHLLGSAGRVDACFVPAGY